jgi:hypothetical protein
MRRMLLLAVLLSGCVAQRAPEARDAQTKMVGLSREQALACAGPPLLGERIACLNSEAQRSLPPTRQVLACMGPPRLAERTACLNSEALAVVAADPPIAGPRFLPRSKRGPSHVRAAASPELEAVDFLNRNRADRIYMILTFQKTGAPNFNTSRTLFRIAVG